MRKKDAKEEFKDGFNGTANAMGIHSVGDFFKVAFKGAIGAIKAVFGILFG